MSIFLAGPAPTTDEDEVFALQAGNVFRLAEYGQPALVKLPNNTLGTYNLAAAAHMLNMAEANGVPARKFAGDVENEVLAARRALGVETA